MYLLNDYSTILQCLSQSILFYLSCPIYPFSVRILFVQTTCHARLSSLGPTAVGTVGYRRWVDGMGRVMLNVGDGGKR